MHTAFQKAASEGLAISSDSWANRLTASFTNRKHCEAHSIRSTVIAVSAKKQIEVCQNKFSPGSLANKNSEQPSTNELGKGKKVEPKIFESGNSIQTKVEILQNRLTSFAQEHDFEERPESEFTYVLIAASVTALCGRQQNGTITARQFQSTAKIELLAKK